LERKCREKEEYHKQKILNKNKHRKQIEDKTRELKLLEEKCKENELRKKKEIREIEKLKKKSESENIIEKGLPHDENTESVATTVKDCTPGAIFIGGTLIMGISSIIVSSLSMILKSS